jgi:hypothetical protein
MSDCTPGVKDIKVRRRIIVKYIRGSVTPQLPILGQVPKSWTPRYFLVNMTCVEKTDMGFLEILEAEQL